jgi:protein TonB
MEHVAGLRSSASTRMSPGALALAVLLHLAMALALWWVMVNRPIVPPAEEAIDVTIEKPRPADPPPPPEPKPQPKPQAQPKPSPPLQGLSPPAEITADRRTQVPPSGDQPKDVAGPPPRSLEDPAPKPQPPIQAAAAEPSRAKEPPPLEQAVPPPPSIAPAVTSLPPPLKEPPPQPAAAKPPPAPTVPTTQPPNPPKPQTLPSATPHPQPRPTPRIARPQMHPPAIANRDTPPSSSPFVNPADVRNRALASENYVWQNARKFSFSIDDQGRGYFIKIRVVIARDGRVVSVHVAQSNGTPAMDQAILAAVRRNSPYLPLPPEIGGSQATFDVPLSNY